MTMREIVFGSIVVVCVSLVLAFGIKTGCNGCKHKRDKLAESYSKCVKAAKDPRECREIVKEIDTE